MKSKQIVFIANDFGFGPLSRTYAIAKALSEHDPDLQIRIASSGKADYLFNSTAVIDFDRLSDVRDQAAIRCYLARFKPDQTLLISTMNRFAVVAASILGLRTVLIDGLYWFWVKRPKEYDLADYQFRMVLPWQVDQHKNEGGAGVLYFANPVEPIADADSGEKSSGKNTVLFTLNGFMTPFYKKKHDAYLEFSALAANVLTRNNEVLLTGNKDIKEKISRYLDAGLRFTTLDKSDYLDELGAANYVLLNGGSNSFLETVSRGKDILFSLPSNQSQYALIHEVAQFAKTDMTDWCPLLALVTDHDRMLRFDSEGEALDYWSEQIQQSLNDTDAPSRIATLLDDLPEKTTRLKIYTKQLKASAQKSVNSTGEIAAAIARLAHQT